MAVVVPPSAARWVKNHLTADAGSMYVEGDANLLSAGTNVFKKGELVTLPTTGIVTKADAVIVGAGNDKLDVSAVASTIAKRIYGLALKDEGASALVPIPVAILEPGSVIEVNLMTGTDGDYTVGGAMEYTSLATDLWRKVALLFDATNRRWYATVTALEECGTIIAFPGVANDLTLGGVGDKNTRVHVLVDDIITKFGVLATTA